MYCKAPDEWAPHNRPSVGLILKAFIRAVETAPKHRDNRQEPILEPHYKLVSIVHKMVLMQALDVQAGADLLQKQPLAIRKGETVLISKAEDWKPFVLESLRHLRDKDKQHWHHRMVARVAKILHDELNPTPAGAEAARIEFRESIFTKTMHIQVWKPDAERPGRHCVYMERYVRVMLQLLWICEDKPGMEALVRRVRKKSNEFFRFNQVWNDCCTAYLKLIRSVSGIPVSVDEVFKGVQHDEFDAISDRITAWVANPEMSHPALDALREALELKKINANQMKSTPIDDLINDAWAVLYTQVGRDLPGPDIGSLQQADGASDSPARSYTGPMRINNLVMNMDGAQISVPLTFAPADPGRPRKIGISRREISRRAEAAITKAAETPRAAAATNPLPPSFILGSNASARESDQTNGTPGGEGTPGEDTPMDGSNEGTQNGTKGGEEMEREGSSEKGSLHDSADDESDLSDVPDMDDAENAMIFPELIRSTADTPATDS
jgi:hypothetical protein